MLPLRNPAKQSYEFHDDPSNSDRLQCLPIISSLFLHCCLSSGRTTSNQGSYCVYATIELSKHAELNKHLQVLNKHLQALNKHLQVLNKHLQVLEVYNGCCNYNG